MMTNQSYDYENRQGIRPISWEDFHSICKGLVKAVSAYKPEIILAVGRAGYYPGTLIAHMLQTEIYPVRLSRRVQDVIIHESPQWLLRPPALVKDQRVLVVDEISASGETLRMVREEAEKLGAREVRSAVMYAHAAGVQFADYIGIVSDTLLLNPWDREIFNGETFEFHPEYVEALGHQGVTPDTSLWITEKVFEIAKG